MECFDSINASNLCISANPVRTGPAIPCTKQVGLNGSLHVSSGSFFGDPTSFPAPGVIPANVVIGRSADLQAKALPMLLVGGEIPVSPPTPFDVTLGTPICPVGVTAFCGPMPFTVQATAIELVTLANYSLISPTRFEIGVSEDIGAKSFTGAKVELGVDTNVSVAFNNSPVKGDAPFVTPDFITAVTSVNKLKISKKGFDIPHPTKKDHRLRYICVEGPSAEVYLRGKLKDQNIIELPEYWRNLVDVETIGVTLTPIGHYQELFVDKIEWGTKITIKNNSSSNINCDYIVFAERKDTTKNVPEYKGLTPADYPGDNSEYVINGKIIK